MAAGVWLGDALECEAIALLEGVALDFAEFAMLEGVALDFAEFALLEGVALDFAEFTMLEGVALDFAEFALLEGVALDCAALALLEGVALAWAAFGLFTGFGTSDFLYAHEPETQRENNGILHVRWDGNLYHAGAEPTPVGCTHNQLIPIFGHTIKHLLNTITNDSHKPLTPEIRRHPKPEKQRGLRQSKLELEPL